MFNKVYNKLFDVVKWIYTFFAVNILWLLFRAESILQWRDLISKMFSFQNMAISDGLIDIFSLPENTLIFNELNLTKINTSVRGLSMFLFIIVAYLICLVPENNYKTLNKTNFVNVIISAITFVWAFLCLSSESVFVYFNF